MAAPTNTYVDYAAGNDYKGASFSDGAYTSATKTLVKTNAFAASKANHWLYLTGAAINPGYYKIAAWTDASTVVLASDAGANDTAVSCTQHDGTTTLPWRSIQGALDLITRDASNGNQINVKTGTAVVNQASLVLTTYGTPANGKPLVLRGCNSSWVADGTLAVIDCGGYKMFSSNDHQYMVLADLEIHTFGNNNGIQADYGYWVIYHCAVHKGASSPSAKYLISLGYVDRSYVVRCHVYNAGTSTSVGIGSATAYANYIYNCPIGIRSAIAVKNIVVDCTTGIESDKLVIENTIYSSTANTGSGVLTGGVNGVVLNNVIQGYSGAGGKGISGANGDIYLLGYNAFYNNTTARSVGDVYVDVANDVTCAASPFISAAGGDFSVTTEIKALGLPAAWYGPAATANHQDIGAVQRAEAALSAVSISPAGRM